MNGNQAQSSSAFLALGATLALAFRFLAWINGLGVLAILCMALGLLPVEFSAPWLRLPLALFLGGLAFAALGLLWSYSAQASLLLRMSSGQRSRAYWIPLFCTTVVYGLSLLAFAVACWFLLGLAGLVNHYSGESGTLGMEQLSPLEQMDEGARTGYDKGQRQVFFARRE